MMARSLPGRGNLLGDELGGPVAGQVTVGFELGGERDVAGETEDLELAVGAVALLDHAPAVPVELTGADDPDDGSAVAQRLPLGLVLAVLVAKRRVHPVDQRRA